MTHAEIERRLWNWTLSVSHFPEYVRTRSDFANPYRMIQGLKRLSDDDDVSSRFDLLDYLDFLEAQLLLLIPSLTD